MKILGEKIEGNHIIVTMEPSLDTLKNTYNAHFNALSKHVNIPGFRKGHAPLEMVLQYAKSRGFFDEELKKMFGKVVNFCVSQIPIHNKDLDERIFGYPIGTSISEFDISKFKMIFEAKFEMFPKVELGDYSKIPTLIEFKEFDGETCPIPRNKEATKEDVVAISMLGKKGESSEILSRYTYDMLEIDLSNTKIRSEIIDVILGSKASDKKNVSFKDGDIDINLEISILEVREKTKIDDRFAGETNIPADTSIEKIKETVKQQYTIHNSFVRYQDIMKWLFSVDHKVEPIPIENLKLEAHKSYMMHKENKNLKLSVEDLVYEYIKNLKTTLVLNKIAEKENIEITDEDKADFIKDIESSPWLYGYKKPESILNSPEEVVKDYVKQFKTIKFLISRWIFVN